MTDKENVSAPASSGSEREEIYLLYQNATANLEASKKRQWQVIVFYSAVVAFLIIQADDLSILVKAIMSFAILFGNLMTVLAVWLYQQKMAQERAVLKNIYGSFGSDFRNCRETKGDVQAPDAFELIFFAGVLIYMFFVLFFSMAVFWNWSWPT